MISINVKEQFLTFSVYVQPRASSCAIAGCHRDALKLKLTAAPVGGAANKQCIAVLAKVLSVAKSEIEIIGGQTHRLKHIKIQSNRRSVEEVQKRLLELAGNP